MAENIYDEGMYEDEQWTYTFDNNEMGMLGVATRDSLYTPETFEALVEDMAERTGMTEASAGSVMMASFSWMIHSKQEGNEEFCTFLEDYCKSVLENVKLESVE